MKRKIIPYNPKLKERARQLRNNSTLGENILWNQLKGNRMKGFDFHRQKPLDEYVVDFFCNELMLAIEVDGDTHDYRYDQDKSRQIRLEALGVWFLRFKDIDVKQNMDGVLLAIGNWIDRHTPAFGHPSQEGNKECEGRY